MNVGVEYFNVFIYVNITSLIMYLHIEAPFYLLSPLLT